MIGSNRRGVITLLGAIALVAGCRMSIASPSSASTPPATPSVTTSTAPATADTSPATSEGPAPTPAPSVPAAVKAGTVAVTVVDGLRVRSQPRVSDDSFKYDPLLPKGTPVYVLDGPVTASDYDWVQVVPMTSPTLHEGWVAVASRTNEPWLAPGSFDCPPLPTSVVELTALAPGVGLACYPKVPITIRARLADCNCDIDGPPSSPSWFTLGSGNPPLLVEPGRTGPPRDPGDWLILHLDPDGRHPATLPVGQVVTVTGVFDHPAAANCTMADSDDVQAPSKDCRMVFAVTDLAAAR